MKLDGLRSIDLTQPSIDSSNSAEGNFLRKGSPVCHTRVKLSNCTQHHWPSSSQLAMSCKLLTPVE